MATRSGHYMPLSLLQSQLSTLELPKADERVLSIDASRGPLSIRDEVVAWVANGLGLNGLSDR
jgi:gluconokinase